MASSVSHDLRHYLASVYANAEFLASPTLPSSERAELYEEIRLAVNGTTDMLDSLLIFSRTGAALQRRPAALSSLVDGALALVKTHPDADRVSLQFEKTDADTTAAVDTKQVERAVYNLLLNACQSARESAGLRSVKVSLGADSKTVSVTIIDSGPGVAEEIRESLFDPFVSQGKQKGSGLGLTLAWSVAREHDGAVTLVSSRAGETIFRLTLARHLPGEVPYACRDALVSYCAWESSMAAKRGRPGGWAGDDGAEARVTHSGRGKGSSADRDLSGTIDRTATATCGDAAADAGGKGSFFDLRSACR
jgi:signal transduction histidine kinase